MIYLLLSVVVATLLGFIFKLFPKYGVDAFQAIVVNYFVCVACASLLRGGVPYGPEVVRSVWFPYALGLGMVFVLGFNIIAFTIRHYGITIGTVMQKMSILLSATFPLIWFGEGHNAWKIGGILLSLVAIWLTNRPGKSLFWEQIRSKPAWYILFPVMTLVTSGILEIILFYVENVYGREADLQFLAVAFSVAGALGGLVLLIGLLGGRFEWKRRSLPAGLALGVPNFLSIFLILRVIGVGWEGSVVFPVHNVAVIALSALFAWWWFGEELDRWNRTGVILAAISIILIAFGN